MSVTILSESQLVNGWFVGRICDKIQQISHLVVFSLFE